MHTKIYHNPRCSKSRETLNIIQEHGVEPEVVEYLKTPPDFEELDELLNQLSLQPRELMRQGQDEYKELNLSDETLTREQLITAMIENPILIERPIVVTDKGVIIGRPPRNVIKVL